MKIKNIESDFLRWFELQEFETKPSKEIIDFLFCAFKDGYISGVVKMTNVATSQLNQLVKDIK